MTDTPCKQSGCPDPSDYGSGYCSKHHDDLQERERGVERAKLRDVAAAAWDAGYQAHREGRQQHNPYRAPRETPAHKCSCGGASGACCDPNCKAIARRAGYTG